MVRAHVSRGDEAPRRPRPLIPPRVNQRPGVFPTIGLMSVYDSSDEARRRWNERYTEKGYVWGVEPNRFVAEHLTGLTPRRVLDLGSGQGRNAVWLATGGHTVTAVDLSPVATAQAEELARQAGVEVTFITADLTTWEPEPGAYDLVLLSYLQLPGALRRSVHAAAVRAAAPGGTVFVIAHHRDNLVRGHGGPPSPEVLFTEADLADDFSALSIMTLEEVVRPVDGFDGEAAEAIDVLMIGMKPAA